jgi:uncharacterized membrane protein
MIEYVLIMMMNDFSQVRPILERRCATTCHDSKLGDKNWLEESNVLKYKLQMIQKLEDRSMPPGNATNMTDQERSTLIQWLKGS